MSPSDIISIPALSWSLIITARASRYCSRNADSAIAALKSLLPMPRLNQRGRGYEPMGAVGNSFSPMINRGLDPRCIFKVWPDFLGTPCLSSSGTWLNHMSGRTPSELLTLLKNPLKAKLKQGKPAYGIGLSIGHPDVAEIIGKLGYDWAFIDTEHSPMDVADVQVLLQAMSSSSTVPIVRVAWNDMVMIKKALDIGAYGIIVPWVNSGEEALRAVQAVKYPPQGLRGWGPRRAAMDDPDYAKAANDEILVCVQIETQQAVDHIDEILSVPGIDAVMIGPNDLSLSLGVFTQWEDPKFKDAIARIR